MKIIRVRVTVMEYTEVNEILVDEFWTAPLFGQQSFKFKTKLLDLNLEGKILQLKYKFDNVREYNFIFQNLGPNNYEERQQHQY